MKPSMLRWRVSLTAEGVSEFVWQRMLKEKLLFTPKLFRISAAFLFEWRVTKPGLFSVVGFDSYNSISIFCFPKIKKRQNLIFFSQTC